MADGTNLPNLADTFSYTRGSYWGGPWYSYWTLVVATIFFGFFGGDHFWLRSPTTGFLKLIANVFTLGLWWMYDILQILGEPELVQKHGLSIPGVGHAGIGAGMFIDTNPGAQTSKSPWRYLSYLVLVCLPFGFDFFIAGDSSGGIARLLTTVLFFLWPFGFLWGTVNMFRAVFMPRTLFEEGTYRMFPFNWIMESNGPSVLGPKDVTEACTQPGGLMGGFGLLGSILSTAVGIFFPGISPAVEGVALATRAGAGAVKTAANTASAVLDAAKEPAAQATRVASSLAQQVPSALAAIPTVTSQVTGSLAQMATPEGLKALAEKQGVKLPSQSGGGLVSNSGSTLEDTALLIVLVSILSAGAYYGFKRLNASWFSKQNTDGNRRERNDTPPEPHSV
jgi:hypothetical protein